MSLNLNTFGPNVSCSLFQQLVSWSTTLTPPLTSLLECTDSPTAQENGGIQTIAFIWWFSIQIHLTFILSLGLKPWHPWKFSPDFNDLWIKPLEFYCLWIWLTTTVSEHFQQTKPNPQTHRKIPVSFSIRRLNLYIVYFMTHGMTCMMSL